MNSPNHLWSGDWERHSNEPPAESARIPAPPVAPEPPTPPASGPRPARKTAVLGGVILVLIIVGVALAVSLPSNSKKHSQPQQQAQAQSQPQQQSSGGGSIFPTQTVPQSSPGGQAQSTPQVAPVQTQTAAPVTVGPTYSWLGTQVIDSASGVTVETIDIGGAADSAGINPGDVITSVNRSPVGSIAQLVSATAKLKIGQQVQLTVNRGTTQVTIAATLADRPVKQP